MFMGFQFMMMILSDDISFGWKVVGEDEIKRCNLQLIIFQLKTPPIEIHYLQ